MSTSVKTIVAVAIVVILGLGAWALKSGQYSTSSTTTPSNTSTSTSTDSTNNTVTDSSTVKAATTITYSGGAFSPATVTIATGDSVKFVNSDAALSVNVASNPHPTHTDFPALNLGLIAPNETSPSVTFTKAGTFGYHNHSSTSQTGKIIVQ